MTYHNFSAPYSVCYTQIEMIRTVYLYKFSSLYTVPVIFHSKISFHQVIKSKNTKLLQKPPQIKRNLSLNA